MTHLMSELAQARMADLHREAAPRRAGAAREAEMETLAATGPRTAAMATHHQPTSPPIRSQRERYGAACTRLRAL